MHAYFYLAQDFTDSGEQDKLIEAFQLLARYSTGANSDMTNAITVSLLEHLNFYDGNVPRAWAKETLVARKPYPHRRML